MRIIGLASLLFLSSLAIGQTINPDQIRPATSDNQVLTTVTANTPPVWAAGEGSGCTPISSGGDCVTDDPTVTQDIIQPNDTDFEVESTNVDFQVGVNANVISIFGGVDRTGEISVGFPNAGDSSTSDVEIFGNDSSELLIGTLPLGASTQYDDLAAPYVDDDGWTIYSGCWSATLSEQCQLNTTEYSRYYWEDATDGNLSLTLPPACPTMQTCSPLNHGADQVIDIYKIDSSSNTVSIDAGSGDNTLEGTVTLTAQNQGVELTSDGNHTWRVTNTYPLSGGSGSGTVSNCSTQFAFFYAATTGTTATCDPNLTDNGSVFTIAEPATVTSAGASQLGFTYNATPIVPGSSTTAVVGADSSGRFVRSNAGNSAVILSGIAAPGTSGDCPEFAANGYDLADTGSACGSGSGGFPITLGSTSIAASSTTTSVAGLSVNGVTLNAAGSSTLFLNQAGGYTAPSGTALTIQTNTTNNTLQTTLNMETSTANSVGLTVTPSNPSGGIEKFEVTGSSYTGNAATATNAAGLTGCSPSTAGSVCYWNGSAWTLLAGNASGTNWLQETSSGVPSWTTPSGGGTAVDVLSDQRATGSPFHQSNEYLAVTGGTTYTLLSQTGAGVVSSLNMTLSLGSGNGCQALMSSIIKITVNGEGSPYISMPVSAFFGSGYGGCVGSGPAFSSKFFGGNSSCAFSSNLCTGNALNVGVFTRMPIPFASGITIQITMSSTGTGTFWSMVRGDAAADSWPNTEKLWVQYVCPSSATPTALCGTATGAATAYYAQEQLVNYAGSNPGRYVGTYFLNDDTPGSAVPKFATLEGNYRIFTDSFSSTWAATTSMPSGTTIMDPVGNLETSAGGTTGSTEPAFNSSTACFTGGTTTDGSVTWTATAGEPANVWRASKAFSLACMSAFDTNGNVETVVTTGTTGSTAPSWPATGSCAGTNTTDNTVTWKCSLGSTAIKALYQSTGTEDYFFSSVYFAGMTNAYGNQAENGIEFPVAASGGTVGAYRFYVREPIRFSHSIAVYRENGDSSEVPFTSGTTTSLQTSWFYTQDTN